MREADWLDIGDALERILAHIVTVGSEPVPLADAYARTLAEPIVSPVDQPPWDNSAMDGYAVHAADVAHASESAPVVLAVTEEIAAGDIPQHALPRGAAARIMTGAPVPAGADGVIRIEHTRTVDADDAGVAHVAILSAADAGRNVRMRGEDLRAGERVFIAGRLLSAADVGVLAMIGVTAPVVSRRPRVAVLATGNELVPPERLADVLAGTHIINSNTPAISAALTAAGCSAVPLGIARDELPDLRKRLQRALDADALITTAGASVGDHDLVKDALEEIGCETLFWRVRIRPGSPFSFGIVRRRDLPPLPVFGLPGNPVSALVTFEILVRPALRRMLGRTNLYPAVHNAVAGEDIASPPGLVRFLRVRVDTTGSGAPRVYLTGPQGSGILTSVAAADALVIMPIDVARITAGSEVRIVPLRGPDDGQAAPFADL